MRLFGIDFNRPAWSQVVNSTLIDIIMFMIGILPTIAIVYGGSWLFTVFGVKQRIAAVNAVDMWMLSIAMVCFLLCCYFLCMTVYFFACTA